MFLQFDMQQLFENYNVNNNNTVNTIIVIVANRNFDITKNIMSFSENLGNYQSSIVYDFLTIELLILDQSVHEITEIQTMTMNLELN